MYVKRLTSRRARSLFAQFRHGILPLRIETIRFRGLDPDERICEICESGLVEDEMHFLCVCPQYVELRRKLFISAAEVIVDFNDLDSNTQFVRLVEECWKDVSDFIVSKFVKVSCINNIMFVLIF